MISKIFIVLIIVLMAFAFPKIYAQQSTDQCGISEFDCYQESGFRLTSNPVICMNTPVDRSMVIKMSGYTEEAVDQWNSLLDNGEILNSSHYSKWNIQLIPTTSDICNITIDFEKSPQVDDINANVTDALGVTYWDMLDHTAQIRVFYGENQKQDNYQLQWTITHELGHAFGLGHYMSSDNSIVSSIMIPRVPDSGVPIPQPIFPNDIRQLKSLYNNNGFGEYSQTSFPSVQSSTTSQQNPTSTQTPPSNSQIDNSPITLQVSASMRYELKDWIKGNLGDVGFIDFLEHLRNIGVIQSSTLTEYENSKDSFPNWIKNDVEFWIEGEISDTELINLLEYLEHSAIIQVP